jgi:hypothetical protein
MTEHAAATRTALALIAAGVLFLAGVIVHPHAPGAHDMAEVAYTQTGQGRWWPAHLFLLASYVLFAVVLVRISRLDDLPTLARQVLRLAQPIAAFCVLAMLVHLLLPLGRDSVAHSRHGWAFWTKDVVESVDGLWALCVAAVAWSLNRARILGPSFTALLGVVGGLGFALFSVLVPLTGVVVSMEFTRSLLHVVPIFGLLIVAWATITGGVALAQAPPAFADDRGD